MVNGDLEKRQTPQLTSSSAISAFIVAAQMIRNQCKKLKYIRRIVLITNARGTIDADDNEAIEKLVLQENMEVTIL
jgi:ATP-dependent DNA helicase 2 subunit 2